MAALNPFLEVFAAHLGNGANLPTIFILSLIGINSGFHARKTIHHLMLVKAAVLLVDLVNDIHVALGRLITEVHVDMVSVNALSALNIAVVIVHGYTP